MSRRVYSTDAERQTARRVRRYAQGLNSQGKPYQRHPNFVNWAETPAIRVQALSAQRRTKLTQNLNRYRRIAAANKAAGLRSDGKPFQRRRKFQAWKLLRASIAVGPVSFQDFHTANEKGRYA